MYKYFNKIVLVLVFLTIKVYSQQFDTSLGQCTLQIYSGEKLNNNDIKQIIINEASNLVSDYGKVQKLPFQVLIPKTKKEFNHLVKTAPEWGIAVAIRGQNKIIIQAPSISKISYNRLKEVIVHEINHLYIHRIINNSSIPSWFMEGMAMQASGEFSLLHKIAISQSLWKNSLIPLSGLYNFNTKPNSQIKLAYGQAAAAIQALEYYYGKKIINRMINLLKQEVDFWEGLTQLSGHDKIDFQENYENYLSSHFRWMFLLKTRNLTFIMLPIILVIGFYLKRKRSKLILQKWETEEALEDLKQ